MFIQRDMFEADQRNCRVCGKPHLALSHDVQHFVSNAYVKTEGWAQALGFCCEFCFSLFAEWEIDHWLYDDKKES